MSSVVERAKVEAEREYGDRSGDLFVKLAFKSGATFAATITDEQIEAAALEVQTREFLLGRIAGIEWCREHVTAVARTMGFIVEEKS